MEITLPKMLATLLILAALIFRHRYRRRMRDSVKVDALRPSGYNRAEMSDEPRPWVEMDPEMQRRGGELEGTAPGESELKGDRPAKAELESTDRAKPSEPNLSSGRDDEFGCDSIVVAEWEYILSLRDATGLYYGK